MSTASPPPHATGDARARWERVTEIPLIVLGIAFLAAYAVPIIAPDIPASLVTLFDTVGLATWAAFSLDYVVRLILAKPRWAFVRMHVIDLAAVVLPVLRPLRVLRVLSIAFLSTRRLSGALRNRVMTYVLISAIAVWFLAGLAVTDAERGQPGANIESVIDGWWWSFITMATVGYGDVYPVTALGRLVAVALVIMGIALVGTITAYVASWFAAAARDAELAIRAEIDTAEDKIDVLSREIGELRGMIQQVVDGRRPTDS